MRFSFPQDFLFGSATSAYQVEGGNSNTDWDNFQPAGPAADHYRQYAADFGLAKSLGHNVHRLSIEWARIEPEAGRFDEDEIEHYRLVLQELRSLGMQTIVTLHHFTNPKWFANIGGWEHPDAAKQFALFVRRVAKEYTGLVDYWMTFNEPNIFLKHGYRMAIWPPRKRSRGGWIRALRQLVRAHRASYRLLKELSTTPVGVSISVIHTQSIHNHLIERMCVSVFNFMRNHLWVRLTQNSADFIGVQYYFGERYRLSSRWPFLKRDLEKRFPVTDLDWEIYPEGLFLVLEEFQQYGKPLYVTENGLADAKDTQRAKFILDHVAQVQKAIDYGIDVRGYLYWSLLDNFEWAEGNAMRFGLIEVNFDTFQRTVRPSARAYQEMCLKQSEAYRTIRREDTISE